jgi:hypothetical protein
MTVWFDNPKELFRADKVLVFWPDATQTPDERINSSTRFVLYLSTLLYLIKRDTRILVFGAMVIGSLYMLHSTGSVKDYGVVVEEVNRDCQQPTPINPMANVLLTDYTDQPNRPPACYYPTVADKVSKFLDETFPYDSGRSRSPLPEIQKKFAARQFYSNPATLIPSDQTSFAEFCYGKKNRPMCRDSPWVCDPNFRGVQLEAFAGIGSDGDKRSGMFGGTPGPSS